MNQSLNQLVVRLTIEDDWEVLKKIRLKSLLDSPHAFSIHFETVEKYHEQEWRRRASQKSHCQYILAILGTHAVGIIGGTVSAMQEFNIIAMWVDVEFRGTGVADRLMFAIKNLAVSKGFNKVVLNLSLNNSKAVHFYTKHNFVFLTEKESLSEDLDGGSRKMECTWLLER